MKILFISDIHGIAYNLKYIENKIQTEKIDKLICLGDLYYAGPTYSGDYKIESNIVHNFLTKYKNKLICMKGNCDSSVDIKASDFPICDGISLINVDDIDIYLTHGNEYSIEKNRKFNCVGVLVYGHEHIPYIKKKDDMVYINVGSISLPKSGIATYCIYENRKFVIYDVNGKLIESIEL